MLWQIEDLIPTIDARVVNRVPVRFRIAISRGSKDYCLGCLVYMADPGLVCGSWRERTAEDAMQSTRQVMFVVGKP